MDFTFATSPAQKKQSSSLSWCHQSPRCALSRGLDSLSDYARLFLGFCRLAPIMAPPALKNSDDDDERHDISLYKDQAEGEGVKYI